MAKLIYYYGTMNSMKSGMLLSTAYSFQATGRQVLLIANKVDNRDNYNISSRMGVSQTPDLLVDKDSLLGVEVTKYINSKGIPAVILVDEIQFFTPTQIDSLAYIVDTYDIDIMVYGLKTTFQGELFSGSKRLLEIADSIREVKSTCQECHRKAILNLRVDDWGNAISEGETVQVGGNEHYIPLCRSCYNKKLGSC